MEAKELDNKQNLTKTQKDMFFQQLESNEDFFNEVFQSMLTFVISNPELMFQVAFAIKTDFKKLYFEILKTQNRTETEGLKACCKTLKD